VWDFTNSAKPKEIAFWERGPVNDQTLTFGGTWSAYYYNGFIYSNDQKGLDVLEVNDSRLWGAEQVKYWQFNAQTQTAY
jgi:hypothetical protein